MNIRQAKRWWEGVKANTLVRNSGWMFLGHGLKISVQAGYFILLARALGPVEYGAFVGTVALIMLVSPFSGIGSGDILVKHVSRDRSLFGEYWGRALFIALGSGVVLLCLALGIARFALPHSIPWLLILLVSLSEILCVRNTEIAAQAFQATDQLRYTSFLTSLPYVLRFIGALIVFFVWRHASALCWGAFYLGCAAISCCVAVALVRCKLGPPRLSWATIPREIEQGFYFSTSQSAQTVYNDIDKTMLARLSTLDATGIYAAAYRVIDVSFAPVRSVLNAAYASFFRHGKGGIAFSYSYAKKILPKMMGYALVLFVALFVSAPLIPLVLGQGFASSVEALRWLALLPFFKAMHYFLADTLTGAGYQRVRTTMQVTVALFNVAINFWLIPAYSWRGAAWASLASDGALVLVMYSAVMFMMAREARLGVGVNLARQSLELNEGD